MTRRETAPNGTGITRLIEMTTRRESLFEAGVYGYENHSPDYLLLAPFKVNFKFVFYQTKIKELLSFLNRK